ncbi:hypothetical protein [Micropruina sonneratiae]|uniref:hypothetical protein n=1 Tax=Micropruina sonneratiae TaxID=2986940 RepID=UPI002226A1FB|nr:hypothetical protein [Micropruina sp. KQZ13P-5]MCW3159130.1 hypothetical protein [Micropruina sp. KQZ13P-5]
MGRERQATKQTQVDTPRRRRSALLRYTAVLDADAWAAGDRDGYRNPTAGSPR